MNKLHFKLIKIQLQIFEENTHDFDLDELKIENFELEGLIYNLEEYILANEKNDDIGSIERELLEDASELIYDIKQMKLETEMLDLTSEEDINIYDTKMGKDIAQKILKDGEYDKYEDLCINFIYQDGDKFITMCNEDGYAFVEEFDTKLQAIIYMNGAETEEAQNFKMQHYYINDMKHANVYSKDQIVVENYETIESLFEAHRYSADNLTFKSNDSLYMYYICDDSITMYIAKAKNGNIEDFDSEENYETLIKTTNPNELINFLDTLKEEK